jgi:hypothetical protein
MNSVDRLLKSALCVAGLTVASGVSAVDIGYSLGYSGIFTDNPRQEPDPMEDEWINNANFGFELEQAGTGLEAEIDSRFTFSNFSNDTRDDVLRGNFDGAAIWHIRPSSLEWHFTNIFGTLNIDDTQSANPIDNQQNSNAFSTGPRFFFRIGQRNTIQLDLRWEDYYFEESDLDSERVGGLVSWIRPLSQRATSTIGLGGSSVDFDDMEAADDFDRVDLFWVGEFESSKSDLKLQFGGTDISSEGPEDSSGPTGEIEWSRQLAEESNLNIVIGSGFSDTGTSLLEGAFDRPDVGEVQVNPNPFRRSHAQIIYSREAAAGALILPAFGTDIDFDVDTEDTNDRQIVGATIGYRRPLTARAVLALSGRWGMTEFTDVDRDDDDLRASLTFDYRLTPSLTLTVGGEWSDRDSTDPVSNFEEVRGEIGIAYGRDLAD